MNLYTVTYTTRDGMKVVRPKLTEENARRFVSFVIGLAKPGTIQMTAETGVEADLIGGAL